MKFLNDFSVAKRLWVFSLMALLALILAGLGTHYLSNHALQQALAQAEEHDARIAQALRWRGLAEAGIQGVMAKAISAEPLISDTFSPRVKEIIGINNELQKRIAEAADTAVERQALDKAVQARKAVLEVVRKVEDTRKGGESAALVAVVEQQLKPLAVEYLGLIDQYVRVQETLRDEAKAETLAHARRVELIGWLLMAGVLGVSLIGVAWMVRSITRPLHEAVAAAQAIAGGDLSSRGRVERRDELGQLMNAIAAMAGQLRGIVTEVRQGVESVSTASAEISNGNQDLSSRTEQMASNLQETASSMEQITATVSQSADTARQANQLASAAAESAGRGGAVVEQVVSSMARISEASRRIADIIGTIDGIAFQTNILALNAAVEAARAGEHGRGFAVVAGEVRGLAQRSAEAAKEIKTLIGTSVETVSAGSALVEQTGAAMKVIVTDVQRVADLIGDIAAAAGEQRDGIGQINAAVGHLDNVTQQNAALVEESAAAAHSLLDQAQRLARVVSVFNVGEGAAATGDQAPSPAGFGTWARPVLQGAHAPAAA
jgi:methyl-accepting chemotaxis protein